MRHIKNERGGMIAVLITCFLLGLIAAGLFNLMSGDYFAITTTRARAKSMADVTVLNSVIQQCLQNTAPSCQAANTTVWNAMLDPASTTATLIRLTKTDIDNILINELNMSGELQRPDGSVGLPSLDDYQIEISRVLSADDATTRTVQILSKMNVKPRDEPGAILMKATEHTHTYKVQFIPMAFYSLFVRVNAGATVPSISTLDGSKLKVLGQSLLYSSSTTLPYAAVLSASETSVFMPDAATNADQLQLGNVSQYQAIESGAVRIRTGVLKNSMSPFAGALSAYWDQPMDYRYQYAQIGGFPLLWDTSLGTNVGHGVGDTRTVSGTRALATVYPGVDYFGSGNNAATLNVTCGMVDEEDVGYMRPLILLRMNSDITLNFAANSDSYLCGMIVTRALTVITKPGETHVIYGHVNASSIRVTGGGTLAIINPVTHRSDVSNYPMPAGMTSSQLAKQFLALSSSSAYNFFVPFYRNGSGVVLGGAGGQFRMLRQFYENRGGMWVWKAYIDPTAVATDLNRVYVNVESQF